MSVILQAANLIVERNRKKVLEVDQISLRQGEILALIGPNGAGKSTLLMALSTLLPAVGGEICFENAQIHGRNQLAYRRQIGMVLQDALLLDASVADNIATGMRFHGYKASEIKKNVEYWAEQLNISQLLRRKSRQLSGGEAQRVSLARALTLNPRILFLDEPFSALDAPTRARLISDFQRVQKENGITTLFVTHNLDEALILADRVAVVMDGRIRQVGRPQDVFAAPADNDVARFVGVETIIPGVVIAVKDELTIVEVNGYTVEVAGVGRIRSKVFVCLRPEDVTLWRGGQDIQSSARNKLAGKIMEITPQGPLQRIVMDCGFPLVALVTRSSALEMQLAPGQQVNASFKASTAHLLQRTEDV